jgi:hypothetical protein
MREIEPEGVAASGPFDKLSKDRGVSAGKPGLA